MKQNTIDLRLKLLNNLGLFALLLFLTTCQVYKKQVPTGSAFRASNVYSNLDYRHENLSNVYLLEIENKSKDPLVEGQRQNFENAILRSFAKFHYFNLQHDPFFENSSLIDIDSGRVDNFKVGLLGEEKGAQAVLKVSLSQYRSYFPMRLHVKAVLVDCDTGQRIWAIDEVFDCDEARVVNGMRYWWNTHVAGGFSDNRFSLSSLRPEFFLNYVFYTVADSYAKVRIAAVKSVRREKRRLEWEEEEMQRKTNKPKLIDRITSIFK